MKFWKAMKKYRKLKKQRRKLAASLELCSTQRGEFRQELEEMHYRARTVALRLVEMRKTHQALNNVEKAEEITSLLKDLQAFVWSEASPPNRVTIV